MNETNSSTRVRICFGCGDGVSAPDSGGEITCHACGTVQTVGPRPTPASPIFVSTDAPSERERLAILRGQADGKPSAYASFSAPEGLSHLELAYDDARLPILLLEAFKRAVTRCEREGADASFDVQRRVSWIASKARNSFSLRSEMLRALPYVTTAREVLRDPGLVQQVLLMSCGMARKRGDLDEADRLLSLCDARSMFLELDSDYRTSAAMLALAHRRPERALELLGARNGLVPFCSSSIYQACMTRTAALEALGLHDEAERAMAFNREELGDEIIDDWLDGSELLAPAHAVWRRLTTRSDSAQEIAVDEPYDPFSFIDEEPVLPAPLVSASPSLPPLFGASPYRDSATVPQPAKPRRGASTSALTFALVALVSAVAAVLLLVV